MLGNLVALITGLSLGKLVLIAIILDVVCSPILQLLIFKIIFPALNSLPRIIVALLRVVFLLFFAAAILAILCIDCYSVYRVVTWIF